MHYSSTRNLLPEAKYKRMVHKLCRRKAIEPRRKREVMKRAGNDCGRRRGNCAILRKKQPGLSVSGVKHVSDRGCEWAFVLVRMSADEHHERDSWIFLTRHKRRTNRGAVSHHPSRFPVPPKGLFAFMDRNWVAMRQHIARRPAYLRGYPKHRARCSTGVSRAAQNHG